MLIGLASYLKSVVVRACAEVMEGRDVEIHSRLTVPGSTLVSFIPEVKVKTCVLVEVNRFLIVYRKFT